MIQSLNTRLTIHLGDQHSYHLVPCRIPSCAQDTASAMGSLPSERELAADFIELGPPPDQFLNPFRSFFHEDPHGFLRLRILPRTADVHIDGAWAGTVDDFGGSGERMLPAGPHRVEIVAPGFVTLTFDVRVPANDTVTFTRELDPLDREPPRTAAPVEIPHKALYIVPRCYIGDRPPLLSDLPSGCTLDDVRIIP